MRIRRVIAARFRALKSALVIRQIIVTRRQVQVCYDGLAVINVTAFHVQDIASFLVLASQHELFSTPKFWLPFMVTQPQTIMRKCCTLGGVGLSGGSDAWTGNNELEICISGRSASFE